ncbi:chorismate synthase [Paraburkholderia atlantica]
MSGNTIGTLFTVTTFGESHGPAIGCVIDGCPPGMALNEADIQFELDRRKPGTSRHVTQRQEEDKVEILSGVFEGQTTGAPIALLIRNTDQRSKDYGNIAETFRPGHADYTYWQKYGIRDYRGGGRSSARLTAPTVAAGAVAKKWLREKFGTEIRGYMAALGEIDVPFVDWAQVRENPFFVPNAEIVPQLETYMDALRKDGDSIGARINVVASGVPVGLGEPLFDRLDADIAHAMMGINAVKGVEIGAGFASVAQRGSVHGDELTRGGVRRQSRGRRARRHFDGAGHYGVDRDQADLEHSHAAPFDRQGGAAGGRRNLRAARPVRRHSRDADRGVDACARVDRSRAATSRAMRRRGREHAEDRGERALTLTRPRDWRRTSRHKKESGRGSTKRARMRADESASALSEFAFATLPLIAQRRKGK